jgi:hypothetical protein
MNASQRAQLPKVARASVRAADKSGALDRGEYTMAVARADVLKRLDIDEVDSEGRQAIKAAITEALVSLHGNRETDSRMRLGTRMMRKRWW